MGRLVFRLKKVDLLVRSLAIENPIVGRWETQGVEYCPQHLGSCNVKSIRKRINTVFDFITLFAAPRQ